MKYIKLCDVCDFQGGSQPPKDEWSYELKNGYIRMLQIRDFTQKERVVPEYVKITNSTKKCEADDILIARYGASLGKILTGLSGAYNVAIMKTIPDEHVLEKEYLYYYFKSPVFQTFLLNIGNRAAQAGFNKNDLQELFIPSISKKEQAKVVNILKHAETIISVRQKQLQKLDELVKSRFIELFGDPDGNPMNWETAALEHHLEIVGGFAFKSEGFTDSGIPVLRIGNVNSGHFLPVNMVFWPEDPSLARYKMYPGDLIMSLTGTVGKDDYGNVCVLSDEYPEYYLNQRNAKLSIGATLNRHYISEMLKFSRIKKRLTGISRGVRQANISNRDILALCVPIPPIKLQDQFSAFVEKTYKSKFIIQQALDKTQLLFDSLMQHYFGS